MTTNPLAALLFPYLRKHRRAVALLAVVQCAAATCALILPLINARLIDNGVSQGQWNIIRHEAQIMGGFIVAGLVLSVTAAVLGSVLAARIAIGARSELFAASMHLDAASAAHFGNHALLTRATNDITQIQRVVFITATVLAIAPINIVGGLFLSAQVNLTPLPVAVIAAALLVLVVVVLLHRMLPLFGAEQRILEHVNRVLSEHMSGTRTIRAFRRERAEVRRFQTENDDLTRVACTLGGYQAMLTPAVLAITNGAIIAAAAVGAVALDAGRMQIGQIVAYVGYLTLVLGGVAMISVLVSVLPQASVSAGRIREVIARPSAITDHPHPVEVAPAGHLQMRGATIRYAHAARPVLADVNLDAQPGTFTCITGPTGSGKSTLLAAIPRLVDVESGGIWVDGVNVCGQSLSGLRSRMGYLPQKPVLPAGTVRSAINAGSTVTDEHIWAALRAACVDDVIDGEDGGLDRPVAPRGMNFSGGQRQRLALARALVNRPSLLVLDDPFSAIDEATADRLLTSLQEISATTTVVVSSHRPSVLWAADQVVHLDAGRVMGIGPARKLLAENTSFAELMRLHDEMAT